jgi:hypothetical protein
MPQDAAYIPYTDGYSGLSITLLPRYPVKKETATDKGNSLHSKYALEVSCKTIPII